VSARSGGIPPHDSIDRPVLKQSLSRPTGNSEDEPGPSPPNSRPTMPGPSGACYAGLAQLLNEVYRKTVLPLGTVSRN
jgi:hypothetical protein